MSSAEYKFTNKNADVRGRVAEVVEFAKSRGILLKEIEVYKDPDALKDKDTTHMIYDTCEAREQTAPPKDEAYEFGVPLETEVYEGLRDMFAKVFGFNE